MKRVPHIKVDATVIASNVLSGVGHYTLGIVKGFDELAAEGKLTYSLIAPWRRSSNLKKLGLKHYKSIIRIPIPEKYLNGFRYYNIPAPIDLLFGPGNYYFPHFRSWPMWFSKSAVVVHDMAYEAVPETVLAKHRHYLARVVAGSAKDAKAVVVPSDFSKSEVEKYLQLTPAKVVVATPAVDTELFYKRPSAEVKKVKAKYDIFFDSYLFSVGNIEPRKNYERLIDAYTSLPRSITDKYPLVMVGADGWNNEKILAKIQQAKENNYKIIHPKQFVPDEDLPALYSGAALYLFTPLYEGFGMSPLEANACGTPAMVSGVASLPQAAGKGAIYVQPDNTKEIADVLKQTLASLEKDRGQFDEAIKRHVAEFSSWRSSAEITAAALTGKPLSYFEKTKD